MKKVSKIIVISLLAFIVMTVGMFSEKVMASGTSDTDNKPVHGKVIKIHAGGDKNSQRFSNADVKIISGSLKGKVITVQNFAGGQIKDEGSSTQSFAKVGDEVLVNIQYDSKNNVKKAYIYEIVRYKYLYGLAAFLIILLIAIGGLKGFKSVITLAITGIVVIKVLIPLILQGFNPMAVSIAVCIFVTVVNLLIISGKNEKTLAAIIGTSGGVLIAGAIAFFSNSIMMLNGLTDDQMQSIIYTSQNANFNFSGLLFAGIIMGALGAVMDVSMSIASSIMEIKEVKPDMTMKELVKSGMNVGKDIMGTMANTLILAYVGGAMYIMIMISSYSYSTSISTALDQDVIASEVLKALAGSIGLIFAVPITAVITAFLIKLNKGKEK
ncbi:YibE/F-like protein [Clostridium ljungdahlii]|uniref:YibE/F-like protein n=2 Tax=Clostridium ljungdahlii TaxID=1538 RepID=A0A168M204_9CLOT|nr:YibE/F family protein [Clostridium ljungdahlii]OAA84001.1 YibE/F-like protein [Clostridium ljungdahlii]